MEHVVMSGNMLHRSLHNRITLNMNGHKQARNQNGLSHGHNTALLTNSYLTSLRCTLYSRKTSLAYKHTKWAKI